MLKVNWSKRTLHPSFAHFFKSPEKAFLLIGLWFGILFLLIIPPFQVSDEPHHFFRSYQVAEGKFVAEKRDNATGGLIPKSLLDTAIIWNDIPFHPEKKTDQQRLTKAFSISLQERERVFWNFANTAFYSPVPYLPQALGIAVGKAFHLSPVILMYLGRLVNLLSAVYLTFLALKITPIFKWVFFLLALTPMATYQRASLSADSFINSISILLIATILKYAYDKHKNKIGTRDILVLFILTALLSLSKQAYFLIPFLYFLIPQHKIGSPKKYLIISVLLVLTSAIAWISWGWIIKEIYVPLRQEGVSIDEQAHFILSNPLRYALILLSEFNTNGEEYLKQFIGVIGCLDTHLPSLLRISYVAMIGFVALINSQNDVILSLKDKIKLFTVALSSVVLITTLVYLAWTPVGKEMIEGIQGRYFIPLANIMFLLAYNRKLHLDISANRFDLVIVLYSLFALTSSLAVVINRFY
jgi:uncharacterized membrane protein